MLSELDMVDGGVCGKRNIEYSDESVEFANGQDKSGGDINIK